LEATLPFGLQGLRQEILVVQLALGSLFADGIQLVFQVLQSQTFEKIFQFHHITSS
jgi:hypothetical protein